MGRAKEKKTFGRPRRIRENNIKMYLQEIGWGSMDFIDLAQVGDRKRAVVNEVMNFRIP
jgi:ribosome biogenesis protein Nip4